MSILLRLCPLMLWGAPLWSGAEEITKGISSQLVVRDSSIAAPDTTFLELPPQLALGDEKMLVSFGMDTVSSLCPNLREHLKAIRNPILTDYDQMAKDPAFRKLPSMIPGTAEYRKNSKSWHYFLYVPASFEPRKEVPIVVFLHGFGGNFKIYSWWWKDACEKNGWVMVCPTFGLGFWNIAGADSLVKSVLEHAVGVTQAKPSAVFLMGLSNGAPGVALVAGKGVRHDGLVFLSGGAPIGGVVPESDRTPALFVIGKQDWAYGSAVATRRVLESRRVEVTFREYPGQSHFLLALRREDVVANVAQWIALRLQALGKAK